MAFEIKQNDRRPVFVVSLKDDFGEVTEAPVNLTTAGTCYFNMRKTASPQTVIVSRGTCSVTDAAGGEVTYSWGTADTTTAGTFSAEVEVLWNDGKPETFPNDSYWEIIITDDIA